jgi:hypothetical protein
MKGVRQGCGRHRSDLRGRAVAPLVGMGDSLCDLHSRPGFRATPGLTRKQLGLLHELVPTAPRGAAGSSCFSKWGPS